MANSPLIELKCTNCGSQLDPEDISPHLAAARCKHCDALFAIPSATSASPSQPAANVMRPKVRQPKQIVLSSLRGDLVIQRKWFTPAAFGLLFFAIFWNGFMVVWHTIALSQGAWFMSLFGLIHTAIGIGLIYGVLTSFFNSTIILAGNRDLSVKHGPLPWKGNKRVPRSDIDQVFCRSDVKTSKNGSRTIYSVEVVTKDNHREPLIKSLNSEDEALFIEQELEVFLGLKDQPVRGEVER